MKTGTQFPTRVRSARGLDRILISGENNPKIGGEWEKIWPGTRIFTLTLTERTTCPRTCMVWDECYGDNMPSPIRVLADEHRMPRLAAEIPLLLNRCGNIAVRTHVLGDYYSPEYARFWINQVRKYDGRLRVFGYTARTRRSLIGKIIERESRTNWDRFAMRFSGAQGQRSTAVMIDPPRGQHPDGSITCPEQTFVPDTEIKDAKDCSRCGLCLHPKKRIVFRLHD